MIQELTSQQEDYILEQGRELYFERKAEQEQGKCVMCGEETENQAVFDEGEKQYIHKECLEELYTYGEKE